MEADDDPRVTQWLGEVQSASFIHSPDDSSPCQLRKRKATSPLPSPHSSSSIRASPKHQHRDPASSNAIDQQQPTSADSAIFLSNHRHIQGLEDIEIPPEQPETPTTGGARSSQASKGVPLDIQTVRHHLAAHGMWYDAPNYDQYQDLRNLVSEILGATPGMDLRPESTKKIRDCLREHATTDESTLLGPLVQLLVKTTKTAPKRHDVNGKVEEVMDMLLNKIAVDQDFIEDGLKSVRDRIFVRGFLPGQTIENKTLGLTDPKPNLTWGLKIPQFPISGKGLTLLDEDVEAMVKVCPGIQHAFFAIEFGSCEKSIEEVENQAIRTGANLVQARRQLNAKAAAVKAKEEKQPTRQKSFTDPPTQDTVEAQGPSPPPLPPKADLNSIAFTVSWVPRMAELHVHWFEENVGPQGICHMTMLNAYLFCREDSLKEFRKDIGNILAWGTYKRKEEVLKVMREIYPNY